MSASTTTGPAVSNPAIISSPAGGQRRVESQADLDEGLASLAAGCAVMARIIPEAGTIPLRRREPGFEGLARIIVGQQLSVASAAAIWLRVSTAFDPLDAARIASASDEALAKAGLSRPKQRTLRAIAAAALAGDLALDRMDGWPDDAIREALVAVPGVGPWTADIFAMFCLGHADAFAPGDLALQEAARMAFSLEGRPKPDALSALSERWRPWRAVAARVLWAYYAVAKSRNGLPVG
jgi:DNA-3-methyladenine glycosylase II